MPTKWRSWRLSHVARPVVVVLMTLTLAVSTRPKASVQAGAPATAQPSIADALCAGTTYTGCVADLTMALELGWKRIAICEFPNGHGDIAKIEAGQTPEFLCSGTGPSKVFKAIELP